jgi:hypothetical protein
MTDINREDLLGQTKNQPMGLGPIGAPDTIFVRKFRWTLKGDHLSEYFVTKVAFDFVAKVIDIGVLEAVLPNDTDIEAVRWLEHPWDKETLTFCTFDGCGVPIYDYVFSGLTLTSDTADFDYSSSDPSIRKIKIKYDKCVRNSRLNRVKSEPKPSKKGFDWTVSVAGTEAEYATKLVHRPQVDIEETEINFLNAKTWIPGKANWMDVDMSFAKQHDMSLVSDLVAGKSPTLILKMYSRGDIRLLETWELANCRLVKISANDEKYNITVGYATVKYISESTYGTH